MNDKKYFIDDRVIIPDKIKNMSNVEIEAEIARLEAEAMNAKKENMKQVKKETA